MANPIRDLRRFLGLSPIERQRLFLAALTVTRVAVALRRSSYVDFRQRVEANEAEPSRLNSADALARAELHASAMRAVASRLPWASCLRRSLALWWLLRRQGIPSEVRFGGRVADDVEAHAWLEVQGRALTDAAPSETFLTLEAEEEVSNRARRTD